MALGPARTAAATAVAGRRLVGELPGVQDDEDGGDEGIGKDLDVRARPFAAVGGAGG